MRDVPLNCSGKSRTILFLCKGETSVFFYRASVAFVLSAALIATPALASRIHRAPTSGHSHNSHKAAAAKLHKMHGQQAMEPARVTEIQQALIREHYMDGEATGKWDATTEAAMQKYQADQGWQTKLMPDSRAIKKLGLGPDYSGAINARNSSFADPPAASTIPPVQSAGFAVASGINP
jgi:hypothetical protein